MRDLTGQRFGKLVCLGRAQITFKGKTHYLPAGTGKSERAIIAA